MVLATNIASMNANSTLVMTGNAMAVSIERLGTGLRIKKAQDDPSGNFISDALRTQASALLQSIDNASTAVSMLQISDKAMSEQSSILDAIKGKLIHGASSTTTDDDRHIISGAISKLLNQFDQIAKQTNFSGVGLLQQSIDDDGATNAVSFGIGEGVSSRITASVGVRANTAGLASGETNTLASLKNIAGSVLGLNAQNMNDFMHTVDVALGELNEYRSDYGSLQNEIESSMRSLMTTKTNIKAAESVIRDVDFVKESESLQQSILTYKAGSFALTQANLMRNNVLDILV